VAARSSTWSRKVFDVLAYLLRHRERVVPKTELLDQIWGNRFVSESALSSRIKSARRAVGDTGRDQRIIKTIYGRGYRFVADANEQPATAGRAAEGATAPAHQVLRAVSDVAAGIGAAIRISGGPGSGKTGLLRQAAETARRQGLAVGLSAPTPASGSPYLCIAEVLREMASTAPGLLDAIPAGCRAELERAFDGRLPTTRQHWFVAVREFLVVAAEQPGAVFLLDDLQLAHREAWLLAEDVARLTRGHRLAVIVAQRPDARRWPGFEVVELAEGRWPPADRDATADLPAGVTRALQRIAQLGDRFDRPEFTAASGHDPRDADQLLEQALGSGVIRAESGGYRFADPDLAARLGQRPGAAMSATGTTAPANSTWGKHSIGRASAACAALETVAEASRPRANADTASTRRVTSSDVYTSQPVAGSRPSARSTPRRTAVTTASTGTSTPILAAT
jgi:DNA-binding winged helix-turn-helix (wHTH) protein